MRECETWKQLETLNSNSQISFETHLRPGINPLAIFDKQKNQDKSIIQPLRIRKVLDSK